MLTRAPTRCDAPNPSEILGSQQMSQVVAKLRDSFDMVILDTPPLLAVSDAAILAGQTDGAVVVVRFEKSSRDAVRNAVGSLEQVNAKILGTVLNAVPLKRRGGYGYGYGYGYGGYATTGKETGRRQTDTQACWDAGCVDSRRNKCTCAACMFRCGWTVCGWRVRFAYERPVRRMSTASVVTTNNQQDAVFASQLIELSEQLNSITDILDAKTDDPATSARMDELSRTANERIVLAKSWLKLWGRTAVQAPPAPGLLTEQQQDALIDSSRDGAGCGNCFSHPEPTRRHAGNLAGRNSGWGEFGGETGCAEIG